jgi:hypothetical protein
MYAYLTLRKKFRLTVLENKALRRIFAPKKSGVTADWGELQNKDLHKFVFFA